MQMDFLLIIATCYLLLSVDVVRYVEKKGLLQSAVLLFLI